MDNKKINLILQNNNSWPIILQGVESSLFKNAVIINSLIPSSKLGINIDDNGNYIYPDFCLKLMQKENNKNIILLIKNLDEISKLDQEKFYGIIKNKAINGYNFPTQTQIILTCNDYKKISKKISSLCINYKLEN